MCLFVRVCVYVLFLGIFETFPMTKCVIKNSDLLRNSVKHQQYKVVLLNLLQQIFKNILCTYFKIPV